MYICIYIIYMYYVYIGEPPHLAGMQSLLQPVRPPLRAARPRHRPHNEPARPRPRLQRAPPLAAVRHQWPMTSAYFTPITSPLVTSDKSLQSPVATGHWPLAIDVSLYKRLTWRSSARTLVSRHVSHTPVKAKILSPPRQPARGWRSLFFCFCFLFISCFDASRPRDHYVHSSPT